MRINSTQILLPFALCIGLSIVFTFPAGSSGTVRWDGDGSALVSSVGRITRSDPEMPARVVIDTSKHSLTIQRQGQAPVVLKAQGAYTMKRGTLSVTRKEIDPLWTAPPTYFLRRGLSVPPEGSAERSMRGALGNRAIFLDHGRAIHSGPLWNDDVGGVKISPQDMALLFDVTAVGATIEVR